CARRLFSVYDSRTTPTLHSFPTRRSSDLITSPTVRDSCSAPQKPAERTSLGWYGTLPKIGRVSSQDRARSAARGPIPVSSTSTRSEEHTSELQSRGHLVCRLLLEKKKKTT